MLLVLLVQHVNNHWKTSCRPTVEKSIAIWTTASMTITANDCSIPIFNMLTQHISELSHFPSLPSDLPCLTFPLDFYEFRKFAKKCSACHQIIIASDGSLPGHIESDGRIFHKECYRCEVWA